MLFLDLAPPTLKKSGIFHDSTRLHLNFEGLPPKSRRSVVWLRYKYYRKIVVWVWPGAADATIAV